MTVEYHYGRPVRVDTVVVSAQHDPTIEHEELERQIMEHVIRHVIPAELLDERTHYYINPTGRFVIGGPMGDAGLTGRKIIVDTYGGIARHGGGAFSGKDPTRWTAARPMPPATSPRTSWPPGWPSASRSSSAMPSVWRTPVDHGRDLRHGAHPRRADRGADPQVLPTCAPARSSATWTCAARSTSRLPPSATLAAPTSSCPGSRPTRPPSCAPRRA